MPLFDTMETLFRQPENSKFLVQGKFGLEKESLRVHDDGTISLKDHPKSLGDKNINPYITTDYSESQMEFITPPFESVEKSIHFLEQTHLWAYERLGKEFLWPMSMPCILPEEKEIPIAKYGNNAESQKKEIYRKGLSVRYGKKMQLICGIHYNFSLDDSILEIISQEIYGEALSREKKDILYFSLARNFLRYRWILVYLFGASPVVDDSYEPEVLKKLDQLGGNCPYLGSPLYYKKYATSLRMSKFGYSNTEQEKFHYSYNTLPEYISDIEKGINTPIPKYSEIGMYTDKGEQIQLNENLLQLENEYYAPIRFKAEISGYSRQIDALSQKGIQHIEVRILDIDPDSPIGISQDEMHFTHLFLIMCLWEENTPINENEQECIEYNQRIVSLRGRHPNLTLHKKHTGDISLISWSEEIFAKLDSIAQILDAEEKGNTGKYQKIVESQKKKLYNQKLLPSQKIIDSMCIKSKRGLIQLALRQAKKHKKYISELSPDNALQKILDSALT